jgi:hypothetical protein
MNRHALAGATVAAGMVLALAACTTRQYDQPHAANSSGSSTTSRAAGKEDPKKEDPKKCLSTQLKWTLVRLDAPVNKTSGHLAVAQLTATNTARRTCTFDGYPWVRVFNGKAQDTIASPAAPGAAPRWTLAPGRSVRVNLRYSEAPDRTGNCYLPAEVSALQALPPHADARDIAVIVPLTDIHGKRLPLNVCDEKVGMTPPVMPGLVAGRYSG